MLSSDDIRFTFLDFFSRRGHTVIDGASLVPDGDDSVLFTSAGMQPLVPYFSGRAHPHGRRLVDFQRCLRTSDIDEVGDPSHLTCFEMLGNWSLGDYLKTESLGWSLELLTDGLGLDVERLCVSVFAGDPHAPFDQRSFDRWLELGIPPARVFPCGREHNWWGPPGPDGPCGPDSEIFYWTGDGPPQGHPASDPRWVEIWNNVFIAYEQTPDGTLRPLSEHNVDTGMGLERIACVVQGVASVYDTDLFRPIVDRVRDLGAEPDERSERIVADHVRSVVLLIGDGVVPSNTGRGYVLRRLLRRAIRRGRHLGFGDPFLREVGGTVIGRFAGVYPHLDVERERIGEVLDAEERRFGRTLRRGLREIDRLVRGGTPITGQVLFELFETHGLPPELTVEELRDRGVHVAGWEGAFERRRHEHRERSRRPSAPASS